LDRREWTLFYNAKSQSGVSRGFLYVHPQTIPLGLIFAHVQSEDEEPWIWFPCLLKAALPEFDKSSSTLMSDRDKGLQSADSELQHVQRAVCVQHIADNTLLLKSHGIKPRIRKGESQIGCKRRERQDSLPDIEDHLTSRGRLCRCVGHIIIL